MGPEAVGAVQGREGDGHGGGEQSVSSMDIEEVNLMTPRDGLDMRVEGEVGGGQSWAFNVSNAPPEVGETGAEPVCAQQMYVELKSNGARGVEAARNVQVGATAAVQRKTCDCRRHVWISKPLNDAGSWPSLRSPWLTGHLSSPSSRQGHCSQQR